MITPTVSAALMMTAPGRSVSPAVVWLSRSTLSSLLSDALPSQVLPASGCPWQLAHGGSSSSAHSVSCGAWFYTGGKNPYGYRGLGEVAVFVFFGLVAVLGTQFTQAGTLSFTGLLLALGIGGMSAAVNLANNIRDIPSDSQTGKITLAVRLGDGRSRTLFTILLALPVAYTLLIAIGSWAALIGLVYIPFALTSVRIINKGARGPELIPVLGLTGRAMLIWAVTTALAVALV